MTPLLAQQLRLDRGFDRIYRRHIGDVYRYALAMMRNPADAEDVTQTTFLNAYRAYTEQRDRSQTPQNWLIAIAHDACRQRLRQSDHRPAESSFDDDFADSLVEQGMPSSAVETLMLRASRALREQLDGTLTCGEAEFAVSRQLDGRLPWRERGPLRAHLKKCADCTSFARRQRAQRAALETLALVPVPASLTSLCGGGAAIGSGIAIKAAAAVTAGLVIGGAGFEGVRHPPWRQAQRVAIAPQTPLVRPAQTIYAGDASVAARHVMVAFPLRADRPGNPQARAAPVARQSHGPPGPFDTEQASQKP